MAELLKDRAFFDRSGGGVTLSGGEVLLQSAFAAEVLAALRAEGIHTAVDTAGDVPYEAFEQVLPHTELFLYDVKAADPEQHREGCGRDNGRILANLRHLSGAGANIRLRVPVIPGFNDADARMEGIAALIAGLPERHPVDLLRFHRMGSGKYEGLDQSYRAQALSPPDDQRMEALAGLFRRHGIDVQTH